MIDTADIRLADPKFKADPYPVYARLRNEAPVCRVRIGRLVTAWLITRYEDVVAVLKDERLTSDMRNAPTAGRRAREAFMYWVFGPFIENMLGLDDPHHARLRALVQKAFTLRRVEDMRPRIESLTEHLLDRVAPRNRMDVIWDYALPLPATIIAEMLGVPGSDRDRFHRFSAAVVSANTGVIGVLTAIPTVWAFLRYIRKLIRLRRERPGDDLISALAAAEEAGDKLSENELVAMIFLLLIAGHETAANLIGNGTLALIENRTEMDKLRAQPSLMPSAIEELLRYDGPIELAAARWARSDVTMAGVTIPRGAPVFCALTSANRDPEQFERPDVLNLMREPNRHLAFGQGIHFCLGAPLARLEAQIAFTTLLRRFPELRLAAPRSALRWRKSLLLRGLEALPVVLA